MYFIEKKDTAMGLLYQSFTVTICTRISTSHNTKEMGHQQLRVACIIRAIEANEGCIDRQSMKFQREDVHQAGKSGFAHTTWPAQQCMQPPGRIKHSCFRLLNGNLQTLAAADQRFKTGDNRPHMYRGNDSKRFARLLGHL